ncbi:MAG TPA: septum formation protein Maf [Candidatus Ignatzschineria merdigallinarum]|uniref:dTTP/UTP pyrophosphatase n=1 Tax=Candidatus Ignatzschineria merdigallinarum TaxID=2838621 RepID=A0A9D1Q6D9_9GAMM|nr:septum formation protein Maf [Candidatus Ignatzschineria merdigallinarum]
MSQLKILLASRSPRRRELLEQLAIDYETVDVEIDESVKSPIMPEVYVKEMAEKKAIKALSDFDHLITDQRLLLTADTTLSYAGKIIGKPENEAHFIEIMRTLSNKTHTVFSALTLVGKQNGKARFVTMLSESEVTFSVLPETFIQNYWASGEPCDKAGGYAIQGMMAGYIQSISGSYSGIMGLPLFELRKALEEFDYFLMS